MNNYSSLAIVLSFFGLWITSFFSDENQVFTGFVFILTFGILHGANDILIMKNLFLKKKNFSFSKLLFYYILTILTCGFLFFLIPGLVLVLFILVSGFHFGEQQLTYLCNSKNKKSIQIFQTLYGLLLLLLLFEFHKAQVQTIISEITSIHIKSIFITYSLYVILLVFVFTFLIIKKKITLTTGLLYKEIFYLFVFTIIFKVSSLIWGFTIYFIVWHSIPSIIDQVKFLYGDFSKANFIKYVKSAAVYWIFSLLGLAFFYFLFKNVKLFNSMFFTFLAAITFPHVLVIINMFKRKV